MPPVLDPKEEYKGQGGPSHDAQATHGHAHGPTDSPVDTHGYPIETRPGTTDMSQFEDAPSDAPGGTYPGQPQASPSQSPHPGMISPSGSALGSGGAGGITGRAGGALKFLKRNRMTLGVGGGVAGLLIAGFLALLPLKLIHVMENYEAHFFGRSQHTFDVRKQVYLREYFNSHYGTPRSDGINDATLALTVQILRKMHTGKFAATFNKIYEQNGPIRASPINPGRDKVVKVKHRATGRVIEFDTAELTRPEKRALRRELFADVDRELHDKAWFKRTWVKHRITRVTGTHWHWLDPVGQPGTRGKQIVSRKLSRFLLDPESRASAIRGRILDRLFDGDDTARASAEEAVAAGNGDDAVDDIARRISASLSKSLNIVGLAVLGVTIGCNIFEFFDDHELKELARKKAEIEYQTAFAAELSKASQLRSGKTDAFTLNANMELYGSTDKDGKTTDLTQGNDYQRATGKNVDYKPNHDCDVHTELCESRHPRNAMDRNVFTKAIEAASIAVDYNILAQATMEPLCAVYNSVVKPIIGAIGAVIDFALSHNPLTSAVYGKFKNIAGDIIGFLSKLILGPLLGSAFEDVPRGLLLGSVLGMGGDLAGNSQLGSPAGDTDAKKPCHQRPEEERKADNSMCGHKLSKDEIDRLNTVISMEDQAEFNESSGITKIASLKHRQSLVGRLLDVTPSSPSIALSSTHQSLLAALNPGQLSSGLRQMAGLFFRPSLAATGINGHITNPDGTSHFGNDQYGFTELDLRSQPLGSSAMFNADRNVGCSLIADDSYGSDEYPEECKQPEDENQQAEICAPSDSAGAGSTKKIVFIGNSLMEGATAEIKNQLPSDKGYKLTIDASTGRSIKTGGTTGNRLSGLNAVTENAAAIEEADAVVIELGTNAGVTSTQFKIQVKDMIDKVKAIPGKPTIYWVNIVSTSDSDYPAYNEAINDVAKSESTNVIDAKGANVALDTSGPQPNLHPTAAGYTVYGQAIAKAVTVSGGGAQACTNDGGTPTGDFIWPMDKKWPITSCFKAPRSGGRLHGGLDVGSPVGTPIKAMDSGTVEIADKTGSLDPDGFGKVLVIKHGDDKWTLYGHLNEVLVTQNRKVSKGDLIAKSGETGIAAGAPHLHFNIQKVEGLQSRAENGYNPMDLLPDDGRPNPAGCGPGPTGFK